MPPPTINPTEESHETSSASTDSTCRSGHGVHNYLPLSTSSLADSSVSEDKQPDLNLKATELRLGLPGSQSPLRDLDEKPLFPLLPSTLLKAAAPGSKRGYSDAMDGFSERDRPEFTAAGASRPPASSGSKPVSAKDLPGTPATVLKDAAPLRVVPQDRLRPPHEANSGGRMGPANKNGSNGSAPSAKVQVVGWPPIRSYRKNTLAATSKVNEEVDRKPNPNAFFVKVSMDGAPYLRKIDLKAYSAYQELSSALEKMFGCFTIGKYGSDGVSGKDMLSESKLKDLLHGSEYVISYEDTDGDWMLVGDVPWEMFIVSCKRLRIMKGSDAIGLAPRAMEKCRSRI